MNLYPDAQIGYNDALQEGFIGPKLSGEEASVPTRYAPNKSFDPELAIVMGEAFKSAWESVKASGDPQMVDGKAEWARETLALRIIDRAQAGERDAKRLHLDALAYLANAKMQKQA